MPRWCASPAATAKPPHLLTHHILRGAGIDAALAGNVEKPWHTRSHASRTMYVVELSSFQLDNMYDFKANIAVLLNITPTTSTATTTKCRTTV